MSVCRAQLHNTSNALTLRMSGEQMCLQVPPKFFRVNSWIAQMIRQWIPDCWSGDRKCTCPRSTAVNSRNWQLMTSGRLQMLLTRNFGNWYTVSGEVPWSSVPKKWWTVTAIWTHFTVPWRIEGLSWLRYCKKGVHPVPKVVMIYRGIHDKWETGLGGIQSWDLTHCSQPVCNDVYKSVVSFQAWTQYCVEPEQVDKWVENLRKVRIIYIVNTSYTATTVIVIAVIIRNYFFPVS